jgi:hypothetical protein
VTATAPATQRCRACGFESPVDATRCRNCTAALGDVPPCPHCRAIAGVSPNAELRFACDVCGGPRVPAVRGVASSGREASALKRADEARKTRATYRGVAIVTGLGAAAALVAFGGLALLWGLGALSLGHALVLQIPLLVLGLPLALGALWSRARAKAQSARIPPALDEAWVSIARDVAKARGSAKPAELAASLGIDEAAAEELAAELDVDAAIDGGDAAPARARIAAPRPAAPTAGDALVAEAEAEAEAIANEAAREAAKR